MKLDGRLVAVLMAAALLLASASGLAADEGGDDKAFGSSAAKQARPLEGLPLVVIDPGHGGPDPGTVGPGGLAEAEVVWGVASGLKLVLEGERVARVELTRASQTDPSLAERTALANGREAELFISLHLGAAFQGGVKGAAVYLASEPGRAGNLSLNGGDSEAFRPTRRSRTALPKAAPVSWDAVQTPYREASRRVCGTLLEALKRVALVEPGELHEGDLPLLQGADMPACLVELATVTHPAEEAALRQPATRQALVDGLAQGVKSALEVLK